MSKYIDADMLKKKIKENPWLRLSPHDSDIIMMIINDEMPAADVEPVKWISVDERLPEHEGSYLVCTAKSGAFVSHYYSQNKRFNSANGHITHWADRPEPPKNGRR